MGKRSVYLHVGLPGPGEIIDTAVQRHRTRLAELDVLVPTKAREESFRAAIEVRRRHKEWGYRRKEVEGAWAAICRRALKGRSTVLVSQVALAGATPDEIELLVSQLPGLEVHVVITVAAPEGWVEPGDPERDLASVAARWAGAVREPDRLHVVVAPRSATPAGAREALWGHVGRVVGFGTRSLPVADLEPALPQAPSRPLDLLAHQRLCERVETWDAVLRAAGHTVHGDVDDLVPPRVEVEQDPTHRLVTTTRALDEAQREIERLTRRNESLEARVDDLEQTPRRLRRAGAA